VKLPTHAFVYLSLLLFYSFTVIAIMRLKQKKMLISTTHKNGNNKK